MKIYFCGGDFKAEKQDMTQIAAKITRAGVRGIDCRYR